MFVKSKNEVPVQAELARLILRAATTNEFSEGSMLVFQSVLELVHRKARLHQEQLEAVVEIMVRVGNSGGKPYEMDLNAVTIATYINTTGR